jgi:hypothetical protein
MKLYTAHLGTLQGFYCSHVFLVAPDFDAAVKKAMEGVRAYVAEEIDTYGGFFILSASFPDDEGHAADLAAFYLAVEKDIRENLKEAPEGIIIRVRSS